MDFKEVLARSNALLKDAGAILEKEDATGEDYTKADAMVKEATELRERASKMKEILDLGAEQIMQEAVEKQKEAKEQKDSTHPAGFKEWGEFLQAVHVASHNPPAMHDPRLTWFKDEKEAGHEQKQMVENVGASGGFLVPSEFYAQMQAVQGENAIVRPRATIIRMRRRQVDIPVLDQTGSTAGIPHWFGGMQFYWTEEAAAKTVTTAEFRQVSLVAHKLVGLNSSPCAWQHA